MTVVSVTPLVTAISNIELVLWVNFVLICANLWVILNCGCSQSLSQLKYIKK